MRWIPGPAHETVKPSENGAAEQVTEFTYGDAAFPGVVTEQRVWNFGSP